MELAFDKENGGLAEEYAGYPVPVVRTVWLEAPVPAVASDVKVELGSGKGGRLVELPEGEGIVDPDEAVAPVDNPGAPVGSAVKLELVNVKGGTVEEP